MSERRTCGGCPATLGERNTSGFCRQCFSKHVPMSEDRKAKLREGIRRRIAADPEFKKSLQERARKASRSPNAVKARTERFRREKIWEAGNKAARNPEARKKAAIATRDTRLAWCPPHLRQAYLDLIYVSRIKAAEAREMILAQDRAEVERLRNRMGYEEPAEPEPAPMGRPQVWPDCPEKLRPEYNRLRRNGMKAADARRKLEAAA